MIKLVKVEYPGQFMLRLTFSDGTQGDHDFAALLAQDTPLTRPLRDPTSFKDYFLEIGALCWKNGLEFSAGSLHRNLLEADKLAGVEQAA